MCDARASNSRLRSNFSRPSWRSLARASFISIGILSIRERPHEPTAIRIMNGAARAPKLHFAAFGMARAALRWRVLRLPHSRGALDDARVKK